MYKDLDIGKRYDGFYRGEIVDYPAESCGDCKIWIPGIYPITWKEHVSDELKDIYDGESPSYLSGDMLPTAEMASSLFGADSQGGGIFSYLKPGTKVWCFFENGDVNRPVYFAATKYDSIAMANYKEIKPDKDGNHKCSLKFNNVDILIDEAGTIQISVVEPKKSEESEDSSDNEEETQDVAKPGLHTVTVNLDGIFLDTNKELSFAADTVETNKTKNIKLIAGDKAELVADNVSLFSTGIIDIITANNGCVNINDVDMN